MSIVWVDNVFLGFDVGAGGVLHDAEGHRVPNLHTIGSPQKGRLFETTAVPELRQQAHDLPKRLVSELQIDPEISLSTAASHYGASFEI